MIIVATYELHIAFGLANLSITPQPLVHVMINGHPGAFSG